MLIVLFPWLNLCNVERRSPDASLHLEYVHGYRAQVCNCLQLNMFWRCAIGLELLVIVFNNYCTMFGAQDSRNNLYYSASGTVVYHAAALGISLDPEAMSECLACGVVQALLLWFIPI
jgi:hypothetical protein